MITHTLPRAPVHTALWRPRPGDEGSVLIDLAIVIVGLGALVWSADRFVEGAAALAYRFGMSPLLIGMTIVSVGTSAPEILVSLMSAIAGSGELAVGNAFGSNIANIGLVLGATLVMSPMLVGRTSARSDLPLLIVVILACGALIADLELSLLDALLLLAGMVLFLGRMGYHALHPDINDDTPVIHAMTATRALLTFLMGLVILIGASRLLVWGAVNIAVALGISELVIGLTIVAIGTSLPELAASIASARKGHADIAIGAVVGSNMFNLLVVLALPGLFAPLALSEAAFYRDWVTVLFTTTTLGGVVALRWNAAEGHARLGRGAGALFLAIYALYYLWLFLQP